MTFSSAGHLHGTLLRSSNTDGAFELSTGKASTGGLFRDQHGRWLGGFHRNILATSSLMAELQALCDGLIIAKEESVSNSLSHHPLRNILLDCRSFMEKLEAMSIKHIYWETN